MYPVLAWHGRQHNNCDTHHCAVYVCDHPIRPCVRPCDCALRRTKTRPCYAQLPDVRTPMATDGSVMVNATAFVVDAQKGLLLTAAHTFLDIVAAKDQDGRTRISWEFHRDCERDSCVILVSERRWLEDCHRALDRLHRSCLSSLPATSCPTFLECTSICSSCAIGQHGEDVRLLRLVKDDAMILRSCCLLSYRCRKGRARYSTHVRWPATIQSMLSRASQLYARLPPRSASSCSLQTAKQMACQFSL